MPLSEVHNVDCMEYMKSLPDKAFDLAVVDPPYGLPSGSSNGRGKLKNRTFNRGHISRWDIRPPDGYFDELFRVSVNQVIWGGIISICHHAGAFWYGINSSLSPISVGVSMHGHRFKNRANCLRSITATLERYIPHRNLLLCMGGYSHSLLRWATEF